MARYQQDRFAQAAQVFVAAGFGELEPAATGAIREACAHLAETATDPATAKALRDVAVLRASIARRFITLSVRPLVAAQAKPAAKRTRKAAK
jgi:hypothetical protein